MPYSKNSKPMKKSNLFRDWGTFNKGTDWRSIQVSFANHLEYSLSKDQYTATERDLYLSLSLATRDRLVERWIRTQQLYYNHDVKKQTGIKISVTDEGIGISPDDQRKLFGKFFRGKNAQSFDTTGLGIGLAYAKSLILRLKGAIEVKSKVGEGTTVSLYLPT